MAVTNTSWQVNSVSFEIRPATEQDIEPIVDIVKDAFYYKDDKVDCAYYRNKDPKFKEQLATHPARRVRTPSDYTVYACVKKEPEKQDEVVGTIYLQFQKMDFAEKAEVGQLAISPKWRKEYGIAPRMLEVVEKEALARKFQFLYLYIVGPIGEHNQNGLQRFYESNGYFVAERKSTSSQEMYITEGTPDGKSPRIIMNKLIC